MIRNNSIKGKQNLKSVVYYIKDVSDSDASATVINEVTGKLIIGVVVKTNIHFYSC